MQPITLRNLAKHFDTTRAVDEVNLDIAAGELFFLLGPSGCGKTTLLRMLAGFVEPTSGSILFNEKDVTHLPPNKRNTGMVFQGYALWPHMTVRQNVAFGLDVRKLPKAEKQQRIDKVLRTVQMHPYADRKPNQLSGGQQQRVALARRWSCNPPCSCWMSRYPTSMPSCAATCGSRSGKSVKRQASPRCMSRTIRRKRCRWPIALP